MSVIVFEGNNGVGKTTIIDKVSKEYNVTPKKSVPNWFRRYIEYARSCEPETQKRIYLMAHDSNYFELEEDRDYILDRFIYSTIIRLNYELGFSLDTTVKEIASYDFDKINQIFYLTVDNMIMNERMKNRDAAIDFNFCDYQNDVFHKLASMFDIINIVDNSSNLDATMTNIHSIIEKKQLLKRK